MIVIQLLVLISLLLSQALADSYLWPRLNDELQNLSSEYGFKLTENGNASVKSCAAACDFLTRALRNNSVAQLGTLVYSQLNGAYWWDFLIQFQCYATFPSCGGCYRSNQQSEIQPRCRVQPDSASAVSTTLIVARGFGCQFAVKGGGHAAFAGASNIEGGITIDLARLTQVEVSEDRTVTYVGAGNRWVDVYSKLDLQQLTVSGGRVADIGVTGLTLGGGISFFSGRHGWACDGVRNYEVVLEDGYIAEVNLPSYPELYFALRGGGNNFGIVTGLSLETFPQGSMWGGMSSYPATTNVTLLSALYNFANSAPSDPDAALILTFAYYKGQYSMGSNLEYAKPTDNPPIFTNFTAVNSFVSTLRITNLTDLANELKAGNPSGLRETYTTATFKNDLDLQAKVLEIFVSEVENIVDAEGVLPAIVWQPLATNVISHFAKNGGNALGIDESDGPLIILNIAIWWSSPSDDARIYAAATNIIDRSVALATSMNLQHRYIYQNYASANQDVFSGYGEVNKQRLIEISRKYDPEQVFQKLQPGYFKLS